MASLEVCAVCNRREFVRIHKIQLPSVLFLMPLLKKIQDLELVGLIHPYFFFMVARSVSAQK